MIKAEGEYTYRYKNGAPKVRWVAIRREDAVVGDIIIGAWYEDDGLDVWGDRYEMRGTTPHPQHPTKYIIFVMRELDRPDKREKDIEHTPSAYTVVERDTYERLRGKGGGVTPGKIISEYPGHCTRCGRPAYVSAFSVAHQNEAAAKDCPARRA